MRINEQSVNMELSPELRRHASRLGFPTLPGDRHLNDPGGFWDPDKCQSCGPTDGAESNRARTNGHPFLDDKRPAGRHVRSVRQVRRSLESVPDKTDMMAAI